MKRQLFSFAWAWKMRFGVVCSILTVDPAGLLHPLAAPSLSEEFSAMLDGMLIGPEAGSCGAAAYLKTPVAIEDVEHDRRRAKGAKNDDVARAKTSWSFPVCDQRGATVGVIAFYYPELRGQGEKDRAPSIAKR